MGGANATWRGRVAASECIPPAGSVAVVDVTSLAAYEVRRSFEKYGDAAFFDKDMRPLGYWSEPDKNLVSQRGSEDWDWAEYRFKNSLLYESFAVSHITDVHWVMSNTLVIASSEELETGHPLRRFIAPFIHGTITINRSAAVKLAGTNATLLRQGNCTMAGIAHHMESLQKGFVYY